ncbi:MAG TPA: alkaline phosphatase family protein [Candidatus Cybelea sp.]|jgi:phospholipase C|nr:alkaline phosphatase family protein [Candidatus Cybelea sp.]
MSKRIFALAAAFALTACGRTVVPYMSGGTPLQALNAMGAGKIRHVVWVVQENRSFNDMFQGYPGAYTVSKGKDSYGKTITLKAVSLKTIFEIGHGAKDMFAACNGTGRLPGTKCRMDGFNREGGIGGPENREYTFVPHSESKPYWDMAHEWVLADRMFQSQLDESFVAHQYIIAAQAHSSVDVPDGWWGCEGGKGDPEATITLKRTYSTPQRPCFNYTTFGDELDHAGLKWRFYTAKYNRPYSGLWSGYQAVKHIFYGPDWKRNIITPQRRFLSDVAKGKLAAFTWVTPLCPDSDHTDCGGGDGPSWVASVVNAVGESQFWDSTVIFVQWDDWGGLYDPVPPPFKDYDGLGFRVPLMVISPYAKSDYVSHVQYETASVLRYAEDLFGLDRLSAADSRATSPAKDCLDFNRKPRRFVPIAAPLDARFFLNQPNDGQIPDEQ